MTVTEFVWLTVVVLAAFFVARYFFRFAPYKVFGTLTRQVHPVRVDKVANRSLAHNKTVYHYVPVWSYKVNAKQYEVKGFSCYEASQAEKELHNGRGVLYMKAAPSKSVVAYWNAS